MKIRGQRECRECGTQWSYYETGAVSCPNCDSLRSRGLDERTEHTDAPAALDLSPARSLVEEEGLSEALEDATERCRTYITHIGFIHAGELTPLSETYLAATELVYSARELRRSMRIDDDTELYLLSLLSGADEGDRPDPDSVPHSMRTARGLACAGAVDDYRRAFSWYLDEHPDQQATAVLQTVSEHARRIEALDGDVDPVMAEQLVSAVRDLRRYVCTGTETLSAARSRLDGLQ
ncbi:DUF7117 family protein [Halocatena pleomorpha]|uniref:TFIIB-type zinc ribbon-containing protein n=1 Tax=Halocatena pleomorpha TaxID=1785090 RepID=A0A3P3R8I2_9EURY|nr:TFIIB-type zinc ribbon-containing protein [Halocatena pleomorpha]RRJ29229.1 TFIIB-type zinc ribbon-containing protein [Halocatena pleomorpha]